MNCSQIFLLLFGSMLFVSTFVNAKECAAAGKCYFNGQTAHAVHGMLLNDGKKECGDGRCYSYKCIDVSGTVMRGTGCYEDFVKACKWVFPQTKEMVKGKDKFHDESVIVVSCDGISACAEHAFGSYDTFDVSETFGTNYAKVDPLNSAKCDYDKVLTEYSKPSKDKVQCERGGMCATAKGKPTNTSGSAVTCDACAYFACYKDKKEFSVGWGCFSDFEAICTDVPEEAKKKIQANKKDYFYYDENVGVATCSSGDKCVPGYVATKAYNDTLGKGFDENYDGTCEYKFPEEDGGGNKNGKGNGANQNGKGGGANAFANGFELSGFVLLGFLSLFL